MDSKYAVLGKENNKRKSNGIKVKRIKLCVGNSSKLNGNRVANQQVTDQHDIKEAFVEDLKETRKLLPVYAVRNR